MHHIVTDGWSIGVLTNELTALYAAFRGGRPSPLLELPVQYADVAGWARGRLLGTVHDPLTAYWRERLSGAPTLRAASMRHISSRWTMTF